MELLSDLLQSTVILWRTLNGVLDEMVNNDDLRLSRALYGLAQEYAEKSGVENIN